MNEVTRVLTDIQHGDPRAVQELLPLVYDELRRLAAAKLAHERPGHTLDATALVHEAYVRLLGEPGPAANPEYANRRHFFAAAAEAMRRILVENARRRDSLKRGSDHQRQDIDPLDLAAPEPREDLIALDEALAQLAQTEPQAAQLVQLRYFAGFSLLDASEIMSVSPRTAHRLWAYARAFLHRAMQA